jgi:bifunctional non-homologous end joining protein LigD
LLRIVQPMLAVSAAALPAGPRWTYEVKWDGYRTLILKEAARVRLFSRNLKDVSAQYAAVTRAAAAVRATDAIVDGEVLALDENGRPSFQALHHQLASAFAYCAFDLVHLDGRDLSRTPLDERRRLLAEVVDGTALMLSEPLPGSTADIEHAVRSLGLEGVVAKRGDSRYEAGKRSDAWVKVKFSRRQEFVIGGYKPIDNGFDSVLVGYYEKRKLYYCGKVRAGFTPHSRALVFERLAGLSVKRCPFVNLPSTRTGHWGEGVSADDMAALRWVKPTVVVEVAFTEWTRDNNLRHASFAGIRDDKPALAVRKEL